jgi:hypothetical protein
MVRYILPFWETLLMNERIALLKSQCIVREQRGTTAFNSYMVDRFDTEKFAELIVRECADICNKIYFDRYPDAEEWERSEEGDAIKKHFGIE